jgi:hypothetical protein
MDIYPNPYGIPPSSYNYAMSMMAIDKALAFQPVMCKEVFCRSFLNDAVFQFKYGSVASCSYRHGPIDLECPVIVMWVKGNVSGRAPKVQEVMDLLSERMGLKRSIVRFLENQPCAFTVEIDPWYLRAPLALHGILTFIRIGAKGYEGKTFDELLHKVLTHQESCGDRDQVRAGNSNQNLQALLDKTASCLNRPGLDFWLVNHGGAGMNGLALRQDGMVNYNNTYGAFPLAKHDAIRQAYGVYTMQRIHPGPGHKAWTHAEYMSVPR